jgi:hypothetical protein
VRINTDFALRDWKNIGRLLANWNSLTWDHRARLAFIKMDGLGNQGIASRASCQTEHLIEIHKRRSFLRTIPRAEDSMPLAVLAF